MFLILTQLFDQLQLLNPRSSIFFGYFKIKLLFISFFLAVIAETTLQGLLLTHHRLPYLFYSNELVIRIILQLQASDSGLQFFLLLLLDGYGYIMRAYTLQSASVVDESNGLFLPRLVIIHYLVGLRVLIIQTVLQLT